MATGLLALLDDVAAIAKAAAASVDDVIGQAAKAGTKAAGVVIDDAAVTPGYVVGFAAERELPIVAKIAVGSLRNKLLVLLPAALLLSAVAPWAIDALLMLGGAFLCYEGAEKVYEALFPHQAHKHEGKVAATTDPRALEEKRVRGAIKTDFILSAEVMAITLSTVEDQTLVMQGVILAVVGAVITIAVYGAVAIIVKADDAGMALAARDRSELVQGIGRAIVKSMPFVLQGLKVIGTAAMIWVGGGLIVHGLEEYGWHWPADTIHDVAISVADAVPGMTGFAEWLVEAVLFGVVGLIVGAIIIPLVEFVIAPLARHVTAIVADRAPA